MAAILSALLTPAEYLARERQGEQKHEYVAGELFAMVGASFRHNLIQSNTFLNLGSQLGTRGCTVLASDMRVKIHSLGIYTYPDLTVVCGEPHLEDDRGDTLLNPTAIVEILSPSTERYDSGLKFRRYQLIPSFTNYLLIAQDAANIAHFFREPGADWRLGVYERLVDAVDLPALGCTLSLADVYRNVDFERAPAR